MAPLNPASKPYSSDSATLSALFGGTTASIQDGLSPFSHNSKTHMSSLRSPVPMGFPPQISPPCNVPLRPPPQAPAFAALDAVFNKTSHPKLGSQGIACGGYNEEEDETRNKAALKTLERHIQDRTPYAELASARLQAICGVRNETVFELPELAKRNLSPSVRALYDKCEVEFGKPNVDKGGMKATAVARSGGALGRKDGGIGFTPKSPLGMQLVDKETGKGLREFLLQKGKECGMRKRECKSITFHDFTPDMRTGNHRNILLGHYEADKGERVNVYEVDL